MGTTPFPHSFPRRGEIYMVNFNPSRGSEQAGLRPALIVSNNRGNQSSPVVIVAAITSTVPRKEYPFNVHLPASEPIREGTILCAQLMTVDKTRLLDHRGQLTAPQLAEVDNALAIALELPHGPLLA